MAQDSHMEDAAHRSNGSSDYGGDGIAPPRPPRKTLDDYLRSRGMIVGNQG